MIRAWTTWQRDGRPDSPAAWIATVARREAVRWHSGPHGRSWASATEEPPEPEVEEEDRISRLALADALLHLSDADRFLIRVRYEADLTVPEIARVIGVPEGTVKIRLHRARAKLRTHMA
jgi:RNA polymerase sigma-70 factor, ECF subfamily